MDLYLDAEWYLNQRIFLIGYAYVNKNHIVEIGQLFTHNIEHDQIQSLLSKVGKKDCIFIYGPDIGMMEKRFQIDMRNKYNCINLIKVFRDVLPARASYKLADIEKSFRIQRKEMKYKKTISDIYRDWAHEDTRKRVLQYNYEDVVYLVKLKKIIFKKYKVTFDYLLTVRLQ